MRKLHAHAYNITSQKIACTNESYVVFRIRKKARYEELLECEAKLIVYKEEQERKDLCCKAIENFLSLRQNMIRCCVTMKKEQQEEKAESSTNSISPTTSTTPTTRPVNHSAVLGHLVEKMEDFHHIVKSSSGGALEATQTENHSKEEVRLFILMSEILRTYPTTWTYTHFILDLFSFVAIDDLF